MKIQYFLIAYGVFGLIFCFALIYSKHKMALEKEKAEMQFYVEHTYHFGACLKCLTCAECGLPPGMRVRLEQSEEF